MLRGTTLGLVLVCASIAGLLAPGRHASADAAGARVHDVVHEVFVDLGPFADRVPWRYVVRAGDTLGGIAERELGSVRRQREIEVLNPGLKPSALRPGQSLLLPPRVCPPPRESATPVPCTPSWCAFFAYAPDARGWSAPRHLDGGTVHQLGDGARLFAVPCSRLRNVLATEKNGRLDGRILLADRQIPRSMPVEVKGSVDDDDPTRRIVTRYRVASIDESTIRIERLRETRFDAAGERLADATGRRGPPLALHVLSLLAMLGLLGWIVNRSRPPSTMDPEEAYDEESEGDGEYGDDEDDEDDEDYEYEEEPEDEEDDSAS